LADTSTAETPVSDKLYKAEYVGSVTFIISKPKRKKTKMRQSALKNVRRGSRK
jgi:preprotein translocase subunit YajC